MRVVRRAAIGSAVLGAAQFGLAVIRLFGSRADWLELTFGFLGVLLIVSGVAVVVHARWARRALVFVLWLTATGTACTLGVILVMAFVMRPWPQAGGFRWLVAASLLYYLAWSALSAALYLFLHSKRAVQAYGY